MPVDYTFPAGHRVGVVLMANYNALQRNGTTGTTVTLNTRLSKVIAADRRRLRGARRGGRAGADTVAPVFGAAPPDIAGDAEPRRRGGDVPAAGGDRQRGPGPVVYEHAAVRLAVRGRSTLTITCSATDASGNVARTTFTVLVRRTRASSAGRCPRRWR